jgi:predicted AlkP superfamily pyrophosphatase or phosphodiesterase
MDFVVDWLTDETNPANLIFMYFDEPDHQGHEYGPNSEEVRLAIERMDEITGYFLDKLRELQILDQVNLIFWSDHGMEEVDFANTIDINGMVDNNLYDRYGSSPVVQIWPKDESEGTSIKCYQNNVRRC